MTNNLDLEEYDLFHNEEEFLNMWPPLKWGEYRPQPTEVPYQYPCLIRELYISNNNNGADDAVLSILYYKGRSND